MPIHSRTNQYWGVNAHFHSRLQSEPGGWEVFHGMHISDIARTLDAILPPRYLVDPEKGLQIREFHPLTGEEIKIKHKKRARPDLTIYDTTPAAPAGRSLSAGSVPTLTLPATEALEEVEDIYLTGLVIREVGEEGELGKPVTWLELLSPTNKPGGSGFFQYSEKRNMTLRSGVALVEIDYLHESRPVLSRLPSYPEGETAAQPYVIMVTNPRPSLKQGQMKVYGFGVDERLPSVAIPLSGEEQVTLDFRAIYNQTFSSLASYSRRVDYEREPDRLDSYQAGDQDRIRRRMAGVTRAYEQGLDLEQGPFEV